MENKLVAAASAKGNLIKTQLNSRLNHLKKKTFSQICLVNKIPLAFVIPIFFRI